MQNTPGSTGDRLSSTTGIVQVAVEVGGEAHADELPVGHLDGPTVFGQPHRQHHSLLGPSVMPGHGPPFPSALLGARLTACRPSS